MEITGRAMVLIVLVMSLSVAWPAAGRPGSRRATPSHDPCKLSELRGLAEFAVNRFNSIQGAELQFVRLVSSEQQVVAGMMYYLVLEATTAQGNDGLYEATVWVKAWEDFMSLEEFNFLGPKPTTKTEVRAWDSGILVKA